MKKKKKKNLECSGYDNKSPKLNTLLLKYFVK